MKSNIKIGLADDHPLLRRGLRSVISLEENLEIIWEAENGLEVLEKTEKNAPDVIVLDISMPELDGIQTAQTLTKSFPHIKLIFLSMYKDSQVFDSMKTFRVKGYVLKDSALEEIVDCINQVSEGKTYLTPELTEFLFAPEDKSDETEKPLFVISSLTNAEKQVLQLITESKTSRQIADELFVSIRTIENHRLNICKKLNLKGNHALIKFALSHKNSIKNLLNK